MLRRLVSDDCRGIEPTLTDTADRFTEDLRVVLWRASVLATAGYGAQNAADLAVRTDVDLHLATRLLDDGCPEDTAVRILL